MTTKELEVLVTAGMLLALPVIATWYWRDNRAISWGALGLCALIPEAASETPSAAMLHSVMAITALAVVLQLWIDTLRQRQADRTREAAAPAPQAGPPAAAPWPEERPAAPALPERAPGVWAPDGLPAWGGPAVHTHASTPVAPREAAAGSPPASSPQAPSRSPWHGFAGERRDL